MDRKEALKRTALLMGGAIFAPNLAGILQGCSAGSGPKSGDFFSAAQSEFIAELAETILPADDTPGAKDLDIPAFIENMVADVYRKKDQTFFLDGIKLTNQKARNNYGQNFANCSTTQKTELAEQLNRKAIMEEQSRRPFFLAFKELTILGFYTTKVASNEIMTHEAIPGVYEGCIEYEEIGSVWAENGFINNAQLSTLDQFQH